MTTVDFVGCLTCDKMCCMKKEFACEVCDKRFMDYPVNRRWKHVFCSQVCAGKWKMARHNPATEARVKKILSEQKLGKKNPRFGKEPWNKGRKGLQVAWNKDKKCPQFQGANNAMWKGGVTPEIRKIRNSRKYQEWRKAVFERDNYTCVVCGVRGVELNADHIKGFAYNIELRFEIDNGRTLCVPCHKLTDNYGGRGRIY